MLKRCSFDGKRGPAGVATSYWRWSPSPDVFVGYRLYTCLDCTTALLLEMGKAATPLFPSDEEPTCVVDGTAWNDGDPVVYGYIYPPRSERTDYEVTLCDGCLDQWVERIRHHGTILVDRSVEARAGTNPWGSLMPSR